MNRLETTPFRFRNASPLEDWNAPIVYQTEHPVYGVMRSTVRACGCRKVVRRGPFDEHNMWQAYDELCGSHAFDGLQDDDDIVS